MKVFTTFIFAAKNKLVPNFYFYPWHQIYFLFLKIKVGGIKSNSKEIPIRCGPGNPKIVIRPMVCKYRSYFERAEFCGIQWNCHMLEIFLLVWCVLFVIQGQAYTYMYYTLQ